MPRPKPSDASGLTAGSRKSWRETIGSLARLAQSVHHQHSAGKIHGQIEPANVTITAEGEFELRWSVPEGSESSDSGSFAFLAPEVVEDSSRASDCRTDVYGLGVLLYQMLCGCAPFRSQDDGELRRQIIEDAPQPPRQLVHGVPREIENVCLRALAKDPERRFPSAALLSEALQGALTHEDSGSQSSIRWVDQQGLTPAATERLLIVQCTPLGHFSASITDQLERLTAESVSDANRLEWLSDGLLFRLEVETMDEATRLAVCTGIRLADRIQRLLKDQESQLSADFKIRVRLQLTERLMRPRSQSAGDLALDSFKDFRNLLEVTVLREHVQLGSHEIEAISRWYECQAVNADGLWQVGGGDLPVVSLLVCGPAAPLHSRKSQLAILQDRWAQACQGMGQVVLLIGEEGMGKTKLLDELKRTIQRDAELVQWNCLPRYGGVGLQPALSWFQQFLMLDESMNVEQRRQRLSAHLEQFGVSAVEVADALALLIGATSNDKERLTQWQRSTQIQAGIVGWLKAAAQHTPLLFIVEDLQWVDATTLELLGQIADQGLSDRLLTVFTFRPAFETPWGSRAHQTQLALTRLRKSHIAALLSSLLGASRVDDGLVDLAISETGGVPLALVQFARRRES